MPRLIVPSNGGGTKLMRTLLAGEAEAVCSGAGGGATDFSGETTGDGDSFGAAEIGVGDSCAAANEAKVAIRNAKLTLVVMWSGVETSRILLTKVSRDSSTSLGMTSGLDVVAPVHIRKNVVAPFAVAQKFFIDMICGQLIV